MSPAADFDRPAARGVYPYVPRTLLALIEDDTREPPWVEPLEGTLVLADVSGFTPLSERLARSGREGAELLTELIDRYFARQLDIARRYGGTNLKFGGDAVLLAFTGEHHAHRGVAAALAMQRAAVEGGALRVGRHLERLTMSVGVHSGTFWTAAAGEASVRLQYLVFGPETAELADLEGDAESTEVLVSDATLALVGDTVETTDRAHGHLAVALNAEPVRTSSTPLPDPTPALAQRVAPFIPPPILAALQRGDEARSEGEHRSVVVQFIHLSGVNELVAHSPTRALDALQRYLSVLTSELGRFGGFLASTDLDRSGVKLIVLFGAPVAREDDPANALRVANRLREEFSDPSFPLDQRIGVNSGSVFAGDVGTDYRREYTVLGDAVNLAARLMASAEPGQVIVSEAVAAVAGPLFELPALEPIRVKGKSELQPARELHGERELVIQEAMAPLLGRNEELETLQAVAGRAAGGRGGGVALVGEAGTGKSRLLEELEAECRQNGWSVLRGQCFVHTTATPFYPWTQIVNELLGIPRGGLGTDERTAAALAAVRDLAPEHEALAPLLNGLLGLEIDENDVIRSLPEDGRRNRLFELIAHLIEGRARAGPLLIAIDDAHDADTSSADLARAVLEALPDTPWLLGLTARPADGAVAALLQMTTQIETHELPPEAAGDLFRWAAGRPEIDSAVVDAIFDRSHGNPLFVVEMARALADVDDLAADAIGGEELGIPDRVQSLLMSRIDALTPMTRQVLRFAAVVGGTFSLGTLSALAESTMTATELNDSLRALTTGGFLVRETEEGRARYRFAHSLAQEVAYDSLLFSRRRDLHQRVGVHLEAIHQDDLDAYVDALAHHFSQSRDAPRTTRYSVKSGQRAVRMFAADEAVEHYRRALEALDHMGSGVGRAKSHVRELIGDSHQVAGRYSDATDALSTAWRSWRQASRYQPSPQLEELDLGAAVDDQGRAARLCHKIALAYERASNFASALRWAESGLEVLPAREPALATQLMSVKSMALSRQGRYDEAVDWGRRAIAVARRQKDPGLRATAHDVLAVTYLLQGQLRRSVRQRLSSVRLYEEAQNVLGLMAVRNNLGVSYEDLGELDAALNEYRACLALAERINNTTWVAIASNNIGEVALTQGALAEAVEGFSMAVETYERQGDPIVVAGAALVNLSRAFQRQRRYDESAVQLARARELLSQANARGVLPLADLQEAELNLATGALEPARLTAQRALDEAREMGMQVLEARALRVQGELAARVDDLQGARSLLASSIRISERVGAEYDRARALLALGAALQAVNGGSEANQAIADATSVFERLGAAVDLEVARSLQPAAP